MAEARDGDRFRKARDSRRLDVDDQAVERVVPLPERGCCLYVAQRVDALVEADRRPQLAGDLAVQHDVVVEEWLFDEQQIEIVQRLKTTPVGHGVGGVGVDLEEDIGEAVTHGLGNLVIKSWPNLHFQTAVAERDGLLGQVEYL